MRKIFASLVIIFAVVVVLSQLITKPKKEAAPIVVEATDKIKVLGNGMLALDVSPNQPVRVGILGESRTDDTTGQPFNKEILTKLLNVLRQKKVQAVFFTGDMVTGWTPEPSEEPKIPGSSIKLPIYLSNKPPPEDKVATAKYITNMQTYKGQLENFYQTVVEILHPQQIPFFPIMGTHEAIGPEAATLFRQQFKLQETSPYDPHAIAYTVSIGDAFFIVISTDYYSPSGETVVNHSLSQELMAWIEQMLKKGAQTHKYLFVLGHEPAFSTASIFSGYLGLDEDQAQRDFFWNLLKQNGVLAYFAGQERLYDRSNRLGVWQIVSGGAGSPLEAQGGTKAFFHTLLLTIPPAGSEGVPKIEVLDANGNVGDTFELRTEQQPLHQLRIQ